MINNMNILVDVKNYFQPGELDKLKTYINKGYMYVIKQNNISKANDKLKRLIRR